MEAVPGKMFAPMSVTCASVLTGALTFPLVFAPFLSDVFAPKQVAATTPNPAHPTDHAEHDDGTWLNRFFSGHYVRVLERVLRTKALTWAIAGIVLVAAVLLFVFAVAGEFMRPLEE